MTAVRPFRFCSASGLETLHRTVTDAFTAWAEGRFDSGELADFQVEVDPCNAGAVSAAGDVRVPSLSAEGPRGTWWVDAEQYTAMQFLLFGNAVRPGSIAAEIARQALVDLVDAVAGAVPSPCLQEVIDLGVAGRALAKVCIRLQGRELEFLVDLPAPSVPPLPSGQAGLPKVSYVPALLPHPVSVHATLGTVEVDLGTLHMLRPGDILRLDKRLDEPADLEIAGERLHCAAYLVASGHRKALEINQSKTPTPRDPSHA